MTDRMRVMTYNIRGGWGIDGRRSTERIAEAVLDHAPDVLCLQEVHQRLPQSHFVDQPGRLERLLGLPVTFQANLKLGPGGYGLAVVSRFPVVTVQNHLLPSVREQRGVLRVTLATPHGPLTVFCTHWGLNGEERGRQGSRLATLVGEVFGPVVVCGDFNEESEKAGAAGLRSLLEQTGMRDADAGQQRLTYPADKPTARIDYVFFSPALTLQDVSVTQTPASDHLPLVADFSPDFSEGFSGPGGSAGV
jgi:endonuclease/exonuclease/phosphatase family metal-dependent hydrolase